MSDKQKSNKQRKIEQKAAYAAEFHPSRKPRSRKWQKGLPAKPKKSIGYSSH